MPAGPENLHSSSFQIEKFAVDFHSERDRGKWNKLRNKWRRPSALVTRALAGHNDPKQLSDVRDLQSVTDGLNRPPTGNKHIQHDFGSERNSKKRVRSRIRRVTSTRKLQVYDSSMLQSDTCDATRARLLDPEIPKLQPEPMRSESGPPIQARHARARSSREEASMTEQLWEELHDVLSDPLPTDEHSEKAEDPRSSATDAKTRRKDKAGRNPPGRSSKTENALGQDQKSPPDGTRVFRAVSGYVDQVVARSRGRR